MPTDAPAGEGGDPAGEIARPQADEELVFATQDLARDDAPAAERPDEDLGFAIAPRRTPEAPSDRDAGSFVPGGRDAAPPPVRNGQSIPPGTQSLLPADGFVIREPVGVAPSAPLDTLTVGATAAQAPSASSAPAGMRSFQLSTQAGASISAPSAEPPWLVRDPAPSPASPDPRGVWATRHNAVVDRSTQATLLRLREEAVHVSWKAAWIAVTSADAELFRKRDF